MSRHADDDTVLYAGDILGGLAPCQLCDDGLAAPGSDYCPECERVNLAYAIDRAARQDGWDREPVLYRSARRELRQAKFWRIAVAFATATVTLMALWELFAWTGR